ncbi:MAG TPA: mechanosensitive ion channel domain-containing protein [Dissulfurispiraceae bacterium]|nr:mechanosensitive ion channel domain-containing protein [Dissulfurispiraceae bacterium]
MSMNSSASSQAAALKSPEITDQIIFYFVEHGMQILTAIVIMGVGLFIARWIGNVTRRWLHSRSFDEPVIGLIVKIIKLLIIVSIGIMALGQMGVQITPLIAGIGVAGVGASLAMQGVLGNLVAGLTIIFTKPFKLGEYIELLGVSGQVIEIELFSTTLLHADTSRVVVPNRKIVGEILHNYGNIRQLNLSVGIAYGTDLAVALSAVGSVLGQNVRVLKEPAADIGVAALGDSFISLSIKPWVSVDDYIYAPSEIYQAVIERFQNEKIEIPGPRRAVRLINQP